MINLLMVSCIRRGDHVELSNILLHVLTLSVSKKSMIGTNARDKIIARYSVVEMVNTWIRVYENLISCKSVEFNAEFECVNSSLFLDNVNSENGYKD